MFTFIVSNASRQHAEILFATAGKERHSRVIVPYEGEAEIAYADDAEKEAIWKQLDYQCRVLGLGFREK
jgi:hypothetical protein